MVPEGVGGMRQRRLCIVSSRAQKHCLTLTLIFTVRRNDKQGPSIFAEQDR